MKIPSIVIIGDESQAGTYILRIRLKEDAPLTIWTVQERETDFTARG